MHDAAFEYVRKTAWGLPPLGRVVEFGSREVNGSVREIFTGAAEYVGLDVRPGPGVDVVADARTWGGPADHYDCVVCCEVLEHLEDGDALCHNAARVLRPGGVFVVTAAGEGRAPHGVDGGPLPGGEFYRGVGPELLRWWLRHFGFSLIDAFTPGDVYALGVRIP